MALVSSYMNVVDYRCFDLRKIVYTIRREIERERERSVRTFGKLLE